MTTVIPGRFTAQADHPFVVFLIGIRVNRLTAFSKWLPVVQAMAPMLQTLHQHPEKGFLGGETFYRFFPMATLMVSYWRSFEDLEQFARSPSEPHLKSWQKFTRSVGNDGTVGIWHETYLVQAGQYEAVYGNMPVFGLAAATQHVPATGRRETAAGRIGRQNA
jgi:hypothetical protein